MLKKMPYPVLIYFFSDLRLPNQYWQLLLPVIRMIRGLISPLLVVFVVGNPIAQITLVAVVEASMLTFEILARMRHNWVEQAAEVSIQAFTLLYLILKAASLSPTLSETSRQKKIGLAMMICLIYLLVFSGLFAIITIGYMIVGGVKTLIAKYKAFKELGRISQSHTNKPKYQKDSQREPLKFISNQEKKRTPRFSRQNDVKSNNCEPKEPLMIYPSSVAPLKFLNLKKPLKFVKVAGILSVANTQGKHIEDKTI